MTNLQPNKDSEIYKEIELGSERSFTKLPCSISIDDDTYYLTQSKAGQYHLLSAICPHMWGNIVLWENCFFCPDHAWRFEFTEGICINGPRSRMENFDVAVREGILFAQIPDIAQ